MKLSELTASQAILDAAQGLHNTNVITEAELEDYKQLLSEGVWPMKTYELAIYKINGQAKETRVHKSKVELEWLSWREWVRCAVRDSSMDLGSLHDDKLDTPAKNTDPMQKLMDIVNEKYPPAKYNREETVLRAYDYSDAVTFVSGKPRLKVVLRDAPK